MKLIDSYIEQVDNSTPTILALIEDVQDFYIGGMKMVLNAGRGLGERTKFNMPFMNDAINFFEGAASATKKIQLDMANISINISQDVAKKLSNKLGSPVTCDNGKAER